MHQLKLSNSKIDTFSLQFMLIVDNPGSWQESNQCYDEITKALLWISLIIAVIIVIKELGWLGKSDLAPVILSLGIAIALQGVYLLVKK